MTQRYEAMIVVRPEIGEAGVKEQITRAERVLDENGATGIRIHDWGMRDLAYRIDTCRRAAYFLIEYDGDARAVNELERTLGLSDHVLRFMTVRQENEVHPPNPEPSMSRRLQEGPPRESSSKHADWGASGDEAGRQVGES